MVLEPSLRTFSEAADAANAGRPSIPDGSLGEARSGYDALSGLGEGPELYSVVDSTIPGPAGDIAVRTYRPSSESGLGGLVFLHGGGWTIGSLTSHDRECRMLCEGSGCVVVAVDYRLAPEHPYPAAVDDAWAALSHIVANSEDFGIGSGRLAVGGDSAGGNLSAVMAVRARDAGIALRLQMLIYPAVDASRQAPSITENAAGPFLTKRTMEWFCANYFSGEAIGRASEPEASPLLADSFVGLAPAVVVTAEHDPLRDEGNAYASALMAAGVPVQAKEWKGMAHMFLQLTPVLPHARDLIAELSTALALATK